MSGTRRIYLILGIGAVLTFVGHGAWAVLGNAKFLPLLQGSLQHAFGITMSKATALSSIKIIGKIDLLVAALTAVVIYAYMKGHRLGTSRLAVILFSWGTVWGFLTAASRPMSEGTSGWFGRTLWDLVERGPNFMLPASLLLMTLAARKALQADQEVANS